MNLDDIVIGAIAAIFGCVATIITAMIANKKKKTAINEGKLKSSFEAIVGELNIENAYFYILNDSSKKSIKRAKVEFQTKYKYESKSAGLTRGELCHIYQITGQSGRVGVFITSKDHNGIETSLSELGRHF
jgi:hypothetical protein